MLFGITAMVLVGISWNFYGVVMGDAPKKKIGVSGLLCTAMLVMMLISLIYGLEQGIPETFNRDMGIAIAAMVTSGIFNYFQLAVLSKAMQKGPNGIIWSVCQSGFIFPFFMGCVFFHEPLSHYQGAGFLVMVLSLIFFGMCKDNHATGNWKILAFLAFAITGFSQSLQNLPSYFEGAQDLSAIWRTFLYAGGMLLGAGFANLQDWIVNWERMKTELVSFSGQIKSRIFWLYIIAMCGDIPFYYFLLFPGLNRLAKLGMGAISFPLMVGSCLISFDLFSLIVLREKHKPLQWCALALCLAGVVLLSIR